MRTMATQLGAALTLLFFVACISDAPTAPGAPGVAIVNSKAATSECYSLGFINTQVMTLHPREAFTAQTTQMGGDTLLMEGGMSTPSAYVCDKNRIKELRARDAARESVRITNRQDVVSACRFIKNASAESEPDARAQTVDLGGDVFYILSDTSRTAEEKAAGSKTTYNYEVRRLTGEVYRCAAKAP